MTEILFIRHAYTIANNAKWNNQEGLFDFIKEDQNCPIEENYGKKQAEELNIFLKNYLKDKNIKWFLSPYYRVLQTSYIASKNIPNIDFDIIDDIKEIDAGLCYARTNDEVIKELKSHNLPLLDYKKDYNRYPLGESKNNVKSRVKSFAHKLKGLSQTNKYDIIVVFAHATVNHIIYNLIMDNKRNKEQITTEVISTYQKEPIHTPSILVPKGYIIYLNNYDMEMHKEKKKELTKYFKK